VLSEIVLKGEDDLLPARSAALAGFARALTAAPWSVTPQFGAELAAHGFGTDAIQAATGVVAVFNYLTRVADASGIEFDYQSPLPVFVPDRDREPAIRPERTAWPVLAGDFRSLTAFPAVIEAWQQWHEYVFDSDTPLSRRERQLLAAAAARECCDGARVDELAAVVPGDDREMLLVAFGSKLSHQPWRMRPADLQALRDAGYPEPALLHAISVVALQNAECRLAMGLALVTG
jgi:alkylhydroperoxidase family enzyme